MACLQVRLARRIHRANRAQISAGFADISLSSQPGQATRMASSVAAPSVLLRVDVSVPKGLGHEPLQELADAGQDKENSAVARRHCCRICSRDAIVIGSVHSRQILPFTTGGHCNDGPGCC